MDDVVGEIYVGCSVNHEAKSRCNMGAISQLPIIVSPFSTHQTTTNSASDSLGQAAAQTYTTNNATTGVGPMSSAQKTPSVVNVLVWNTNYVSGQYNLYEMHNDGTNTFTYTANTNVICLQNRQAGTFYLDNIKVSTVDTDTVVVRNQIAGGYRYGFN